MKNCCCCGERTYDCCPPNHREAGCHCISEDCKKQCSRDGSYRKLEEKKWADKKASRNIKLELKISEETQKKLILILEKERAKGRKISDDFFRTNDLFEELIENYEL